MQVKKCLVNSLEMIKNKGCTLKPSPKVQPICALGLSKIFTVSELSFVLADKM